MWKKMLSLMLVCGLVLMLGACSSNESYDYENDEYDVGEEEYYENEDSGSGDAAELVSRGTWGVEDPNGYKVQGEIKTSGLIRASDWGMVESTFNNLSPSESLPGFDTVSPDGANQDTSAVLVGTIELTNMTDGWDFTESSPYECRIRFETPGLNGDNFSSLCIMYGSGIKKYDFGGIIGFLDTHAIMKANSWKVPFAIVIPNVFTPNEPDGTELVLNTEFTIYSGTETCKFMMPSLME